MTHSLERETGEGGGVGGGLEINVKAKKLGSQMVMVETSIHREFPATVPCLSPLDYFLVQGLAHFKASSLPTSVIRSCKEAYISAEKHAENLKQN